MAATRCKKQARASARARGGEGVKQDLVRMRKLFGHWVPSLQSAPQRDVRTEPKTPTNTGLQIESDGAILKTADCKRPKNVPPRTQGKLLGGEVAVGQGAADAMCMRAPIFDLHRRRSIGRQQTAQMLIHINNLNFDVLLSMAVAESVELDRRFRC